ncbi:TauD/TfdA dioxygenase family protein [Streptomyces sp. NPDC059008]|uniref:TauD/TfdA dioxygenase family protein n=1 Tax=Streptomyces sp. NPDC059008 TaxID=3346693 RepID=UPI0036745D6C
MTTVSAGELEIIRLTGNIGAEIRGLDLASDLPQDTITAIRTALVTHKVIFFRSQHALDGPAQEHLARRFGTPTTAYPTLPSLGGAPAILDLDYQNSPLRADFWHADVTFIQRPPLGSLLRAVSLPPYGGDTVWANTATAYTALPKELRSLADDLWAVHANTPDNAPTLSSDDSPQARTMRETFTARSFITEHPVVRVHPETGERLLLLSKFIRRFVGWTTEDSQPLLTLLRSYIPVPERVVRWRWAAGDVAFWDNRATEHYAVRDYDPHPRRMQRITLAGDVPVSVQGERSRVVAGDDTHFTTSLACPHDGEPADRARSVSPPAT